jgi:NADH:ubiquinone reductase (H+-translocating)
MMKSAARKRVVIIGGGFAGLNCAQRLADHKDLQITLLDRNNYQQFQPLLYQVATGTLSPDNAAFNLRAVLAHHDNVDVAMAEIRSVDLATRTAFSVNGDKYEGDFLVLAAGAEANFFGIPGVREHALPLYSLIDAERMRSRLLAILESADRESGKVAESPLRFVVIGGGATGVEIAGAIGDLLQRTPDYVFKHVDLRRASVTLIDQASTVLGPFSKHSQEYAKEMLLQRGVELRLGLSVSEVTGTSVVLSDGTSIPAKLVIWAGGLKASGLSNSLGFKPGRGGRVDVQPDLSVAGFPRVYALGDFANFRTTGDALPQLASVAQQAGRHCAKNIVAVAAGHSGKPFEYLDKGIMAMVGRNAAVAEIGSSHHPVTGTLAFAAWLGVHALLLTTVRAKIGTFLEWAWEYFGHVHIDPILDRPELDWSNHSSGPPLETLRPSRSEEENKRS